METEKVKPRGKVASGKTQVNWRINTEDLHQIEIDAGILGFSTIPAFVNSLFRRYVRGTTIKRGEQL